MNPQMPDSEACLLHGAQRLIAATKEPWPEAALSAVVEAFSSGVDGHLPHDQDEHMVCADRALAALEQAGFVHRPGEHPAEQERDTATAVAERLLEGWFVSHRFVSGASIPYWWRRRAFEELMTLAEAAFVKEHR